MPEFTSQLSAEVIEKLLGKAREMAGRAYAPYSKFHVGAAVIDANGEVYGGCNVENASFGLTVCAERHAVGLAVSEGAAKLQAVCVFAPVETFTYPCGACRQVLHEFNPQMEIHLLKDNGEHMATRLDKIFGAGFDFDTKE